MSLLAIQNRFGYFPWEWDEFSLWQKLRMYFDAFHLGRGHYCHFIKARAEIWRGRVSIDGGIYYCQCRQKSRHHCWCEYNNGVLRQGKYNRKGERVVKYEYRFSHHKNLPDEDAESLVRHVNRATPLGVKVRQGAGAEGV